jgi:hypothetical protein
MLRKSVELEPRAEEAKQQKTKAETLKDQEGQVQGC